MYCTVCCLFVPYSEQKRKQLILYTWYDKTRKRIAERAHIAAKWEMKALHYTILRVKIRYVNRML